MLKQTVGHPNHRRQPRRAVDTHIIWINLQEIILHGKNPTPKGWIFNNSICIKALKWKRREIEATLVAVRISKRVMKRWETEQRQEHSWDGNVFYIDSIIAHRKLVLMLALQGATIRVELEKKTLALCVLCLTTSVVTWLSRNWAFCLKHRMF